MQMQTRDAFSAVVRHKAKNMMESFFQDGEYYRYLMDLAKQLAITGEALCVLGAIDAMIFDMAQAGGFTGETLTDQNGISAATNSGSKSSSNCGKAKRPASSGSI